MNIPSSIRAGDTITWTESINDYPATDGWILAFTLYAYGKTSITITGSTSGADYLILLDPDDTDGYEPGTYSWQAYVYKTVDAVITERYTLANGSIQILPDLSATSGTVDLRSHVKRTLDAIETLLEGKSSADVLSYSIAGRSLSKMSIDELLKWRNLYLSEYQRELDAEGIAGDNPRRVGVRFNRI